MKVIEFISSLPIELNTLDVWEDSKPLIQFNRNLDNSDIQEYQRILKSEIVCHQYDEEKKWSRVFI